MDTKDMKEIESAIEVILFASGEPELTALAQHGIFLFAFSYLFSGVNTFATSLFSLGLTHGYQNYSTLPPSCK